MHHAELVQHLAKVLRCTKHVGTSIVAVPDSDCHRGPGHELAEADGACLAQCDGIVAGFGPDERVEQARRQRILSFRCSDMREVDRSSEAIDPVFGSYRVGWGNKLSLQLAG